MDERIGLLWLLQVDKWEIQKGLLSSRTPRRRFPSGRTPQLRLPPTARGRGRLRRPAPPRWLRVSVQQVEGVLGVVYEVDAWAAPRISVRPNSPPSPARCPPAGICQPKGVVSTMFPSPPLVVRMSAVRCERDAQGAVEIAARVTVKPPSPIGRLAEQGEGHGGDAVVQCVCDIQHADGPSASPVGPIMSAASSVRSGKPVAITCSDVTPAVTSTAVRGRCARRYLRRWAFHRSDRPVEYVCDEQRAVWPNARPPSCPTAR